MKSLLYFVVGLLLISSFAVVGMRAEADVYEEETINLQFSEPNVEPITIGGENYVEVDVEGANTYILHAGEPMLPVRTTTLSLPFGTKIVGVECETPEDEARVLSDKIVPAPEPVILGMRSTAAEQGEHEMYESEDLFPDNWFSYYTAGGLDKNNEHKTFLTIRAYPVRYSPATDTIYYVENLVLTITYKEPETDPFPENSGYDLVIIAPSEFSGELQGLVDHKNNLDPPVSTILKTTEEIYGAYPGVDEPEQIKYFIKDAIETWDIKYVMLVGGLKSLIGGILKDNSRDDDNQGTAGWHLPVRYTNLKDPGEVYDPGTISDLYYADIYDGEGNFSSWDSDRYGNSDGIFAKWSQFISGKDIIDLYPDVYVGRLACRNIYEVKIMVNKIINYESTPSGSWFNRMILIGGDSHDESKPPLNCDTQWPEGEIACDAAFDHVSGFTAVRLYGSNRYSDPEHTPSPENIKREISAGAGLLLFEGHGNPGSWNTHWPGVFGWENATPGGIQIKYFPELRNGGKLPVCVVGGCHNSQFNVSLLSTILNRPFMWTRMPVPECWSWWLTRKIGGGSIATMGNTGLGYGYVGCDKYATLEGLGTYLGVQFFKEYSKGAHILGEAWGQAIGNYTTMFECMKGIIDCKTVQQWPILGDPSLKIGGYGGHNAGIDGAEAGIVAAIGEEIEFHGVASGGSTWHWDFGDGETSTEKDPTHTYDEVGYYTVVLTVTNSNNKVDTYDTIVSVKSKPNKPSGPTSGKPGVEYTFTAHVTSDPSWDQIFYYFDWGDGTYSDLFGPSDQTVEAKHTWSHKGTYQIRVKAWLINSNADLFEETAWSDPLSVSMPKNKQLISLEAGIYVDNVKKISFPITIIVDSIDITVDTTDDYGINRVEFYIDDELKSTDDTAPYSWTWDEFSFGGHTLKVIAYDNEDNSATDEMKVWKFF